MSLDHLCCEKIKKNKNELFSVQKNIPGVLFQTRKKFPMPLFYTLQLRVVKYQKASLAESLSPIRVFFNCQETEGIRTEPAFENKSAVI